MSVQDGGSAFPRSGFEVDAHVPSVRDTLPQDGMSLRDYLAGQALIGLVMRAGPVTTAATRAYEYADAALKVREAKS